MQACDGACSRASLVLSVPVTSSYFNSLCFFGTSGCFSCITAGNTAKFYSMTEFWGKDAYYYLGENNNTECFYNATEVKISEFLTFIFCAMVAYGIDFEKFEKLFNRLYHNRINSFSALYKNKELLF